MGAFVLLTCFLYQKGSPESKDPEEEHPSDEAPAAGRGRSDAPWPVHRGGWVLWLYSRSLTFMFFWLFAMCFFLHAVSGAGEYNREQALIGEPGTTWLGYLATAQFWFESFQNWQSEFLSLGAFVVLSVYLRQRGSAESKAVSSSHDVHE